MEIAFKNDRTIIFHLDGKILMKGIESELLKDGIISERVNLGLGDRFDMTDYPTHGKVTRVRVMEIKEKNIEATSPKLRTTEYFLVVYKDKR